MAKKASGLGDTIEGITKATGIDKAVKAAAKVVGIEDCGCEKRRDWANKILPYGNAKPDCMNDEQLTHYEQLKDKYFKKTKGKSQITFSGPDMDLLMNLYNSVNGTNVKQCQGCRINVYWDRLTKVYTKLTTT